MKSIRVLAIDPGTHCGYSIMDVPRPMPACIRPNRLTSGIWNLDQKRFEGAGMRFLRLQRFLEDVNPDFVAYEQVNFAHRSTQASAVYWGIVSTITAYCEAQTPKIPYAGVLTGDVKRRATGKGGGPGTKKPDMTKAANILFNIQPPLDEVDKAANHDHDIADAMWIMQIALEEYASVVTPRSEWVAPEPMPEKPKRCKRKVVEDE